MNETSRARACRVFTWMLTAATLLVAALLMLQCAAIYFTGTAPSNLTETGVYIQPVYSREIVAEWFSQIAWAVWLWLALLLAVLAIRQPGAGEVLKPPLANQLALLQLRTEATPEMLRQQKKRRLIHAVCAAACALCLAPAALYLTDLTHFASRDLEPVMGAMMLHITPWILAAFVCIMVCEQLSHQSMLLEIRAAKQAPKRQPEAASVQSAKARGVARAALYMAAAAMLIAGVLNGGMRDVLVKAVNICTECIGLG